MQGPKAFMHKVFLMIYEGVISILWNNIGMFSVPASIFGTRILGRGHHFFIGMKNEGFSLYEPDQLKMISNRYHKTGILSTQKLL